MEEHLSDSNKKRRIEVAAASPLATLWLHSMTHH